MPHSWRRQWWGWLCVVVVAAGDHAKVAGRPPHCGPRRPPRTKIIRTLTADQLRQPSVQATFTATTPASVNPVPAAALAVDQQLSLHLSDIQHGAGSASGRSPTESSWTVLQQQRETDAISGSLSRGGDVSPATLTRAALSLDDVDLWEDISESAADLSLHYPPRDTSDSGLVIVADPPPYATGPTLPIATANQTGPADLTTSDDNERQLGWNRRHKHQATSSYVSSVSQQTTSAGDTLERSDWHCPSPMQVAPPSSSSTLSAAEAAAAAACASPGFIPSIVESSGRPATANKSAADLSNGSVELHQRRTGTGLHRYVRAMQLRLVGSRHQSTMMTPEVRVTEAKVTRSRRRSNSIAVQSVDLI